jgi:hypothetical protein
VDAGPDQQLLGVSFPALVSLEGTVSDELPAGNPGSRHYWSKVSGPEDSDVLERGLTDDHGVGSPRFGTYVLQLAASDGVSTRTDFVTILVDSQPSLAGADAEPRGEQRRSVVDGTSLTLSATLHRLELPSDEEVVAVQFDIAGANAQTAIAATDAAGVARYTYVGTNVGTDNITATALGAGGTPTATAAWNLVDRGAPGRRSSAGDSRVDRYARRIRRR